MNIDEELFRKHIDDAPYLLGEAEEKWGFVKDSEESNGPSWPLALFWVSARECGNGPAKYYLRVELTKYNHLAPRGCFWDLGKNSMLEIKERPKVTGIHAQAFRTDWKNGLEIYAPWDRSGLEAHPDWRQAHAPLAWKEGTSRIEDYLDRMWKILNSEQYHGKIGS